MSGGGHPANVSPPASEAIDDAFGQNERGRGQTPGVGVPGSWTNPVGATEEEISELARRYWEDEGRPEGKAQEHWLRAVNELRERSVSMPDVGARQ